MEYPFRPATLKERQEFYKKEFNMSATKRWLASRIKPQIFELDFGTETKIIKDKQFLNQLIVFTGSIEKLKGKAIKELPEDIYYDRNIYANLQEALKKRNFRNAIETKNWKGQELAFDIDPENIPCKCKKRKVGELFKFCNICLDKAKTSTLEIHKALKRKFNRVEIVYSGRGYHLHVFDKAASKLSLEQRIVLNKQLRKFPIDDWVSRGRIRLIRLPYSLNALVSRICWPLKINEIKKFNPASDERVIPKFLH